MYQFDSRVRYSETDERGRLSVTGMMNYLQDCSTFQSEDAGLGVSYLEERHQAWWLSSWQIIIDRYPALGEKIVISTWPYDFKGIYAYRNFMMQDSKGDYLVRANSIWFLFDTKAGRPARVTNVDIDGYGAMEERLDMEYAPRRIALPEDYGLGHPVLVMKHHIDTNHHVNNAQYVEIAREFLPDDFHIKELRVEYRKAAVMGDYLTPRVSRIKEGYVTALCDEEKSPYAVIWMGGSSGLDRP